MSLFNSSEGPGIWQIFTKRSDIRDLPVEEQRKKYLTEQLQFEDFISQQRYLQQVAIYQQTQAQGGVSSMDGDSSYVFGDRSELDLAISEWISDEASAIATYGQINTWDVTAVTDMSSLFQNKTNLVDF